MDCHDCKSLRGLCGCIKKEEHYRQCLLEMADILDGWCNEINNGEICKLEGCENQKYARMLRISASP